MSSATDPAADPSTQGPVRPAFDPGAFAARLIAERRMGPALILDLGNRLNFLPTRTSAILAAVKALSLEEREVLILRAADYSTHVIDYALEALQIDPAELDDQQRAEHLPEAVAAIIIAEQVLEPQDIRRAFTP